MVYVVGFKPGGCFADKAVHVDVVRFTLNLLPRVGVKAGVIFFASPAKFVEPGKICFIDKAKATAHKLDLVSGVLRREFKQAYQHLPALMSLFFAAML